MPLFVVRGARDAERRKAEIQERLLHLAHEKLMLELRMSTVIEIQNDLNEELAAIENRIKETE